jgi:hypothetical protein
MCAIMNSCPQGFSQTLLLYIVLREGKISLCNCATKKVFLRNTGNYIFLEVQMHY